MPQSKLPAATGLTAVLICTMSVLSPAASAQTNPDPGKTERLNVQMQNAAMAAAGNKPPAPPATPNPDCTLIVPKNALTAAGLATPYQLTATNPGLGACTDRPS